MKIWINPDLVSMDIEDTQGDIKGNNGNNGNIGSNGNNTATYEECPFCHKIWTGNPKESAHKGWCPFDNPEGVFDEGLGS